MVERYLNLIQDEIPTVTKDDLYCDLSKSSLSSLEILMVRGVLERYFNTIIPDEVWYRHSTLSEAIEYFQNNFASEIGVLKMPPKKVSISDKVEIRMPQMANENLSENWLLKYLGDFHWKLLGKGLDVDTSQLFDANEQRLYATFVRISYDLSFADIFYENEVISFDGEVNAFGTSTLLSQITGSSEINHLKANLLTVFSVKSDAPNVVQKARIDKLSNIIPQLNRTSSFFTEFNLVKKKLVEKLDTKYGVFPISESKVLFEKVYEINPFIDVNGVGLLYFASYPLISDLCLIAYPELKDFASYRTVYRDIFYFGNCKKNDKIIFNLNYIEKTKTFLKYITTLYRSSDNVLIAKIITVKK